MSRRCYKEEESDSEFVDSEDELSPKARQKELEDKYLLTVAGLTKAKLLSEKCTARWSNKEKVAILQMGLERGFHKYVLPDLEDTFALLSHFKVPLYRLGSRATRVLLDKILAQVRYLLSPEQLPGLMKRKVSNDGEEYYFSPSLLEAVEKDDFSMKKIKNEEVWQDHLNKHPKDYSPCTKRTDMSSPSEWLSSVMNALTEQQAFSKKPLEALTVQKAPVLYAYEPTLPAYSTPATYQVSPPAYSAPSTPVANVTSTGHYRPQYAGGPARPAYAPPQQHHQVITPSYSAPSYSAPSYSAPPARHQQPRTDAPPAAVGHAASPAYASPPQQQHQVITPSYSAPSHSAPPGRYQQPRTDAPAAAAGQVVSTQYEGALPTLLASIGSYRSQYAGGLVDSSFHTPTPVARTVYSASQLPSTDGLPPPRPRLQPANDATKGLATHFPLPAGLVADMRRLDDPEPQIAELARNYASFLTRLKDLAVACIGSNNSAESCAELEKAWHWNNGSADFCVQNDYSTWAVPAIPAVQET